MSNLLAAAHFAAVKHATQRRKDHAETPYINHPIEVAELLQRIGGVDDETVLIAALLHDTIEDTETTEDEIHDHFGPDVLGLVVECTDDKRLEKAERKRLQIVNAPKKSDGAKQIKLADKLCNLRSILVDAPVGWSVQRQRDYFMWAEQVCAGLAGVNAILDAADRHGMKVGLVAAWQNLYLPGGGADAGIGTSDQVRGTITTANAHAYGR
ncbi:MAG: HD domain-containing protein, partial [Planctomycetota bacterium]